MKEFKIEITEILSKIVEVKANNIDEAIEKVKIMYNEESIILDSNNFVNKEIKVVNDE